MNTSTATTCGHYIIVALGFYNFHIEVSNTTQLLPHNTLYRCASETHTHPVLALSPTRLSAVKLILISNAAIFNRKVKTALFGLNRDRPTYKYERACGNLPNLHGKQNY